MGTAWLWPEGFASHALLKANDVPTNLGRQVRLVGNAAPGAQTPCWH